METLQKPVSQFCRIIINIMKLVTMNYANWRIGKSVKLKMQEW
jgi:hypothetical protein